MMVIRGLLLGLALTTAPLAVAAQTASPPPVTATDRVLGRADAPVTVIEYASFTCSHCGEWHTTVYPAFKARFVDTGQVRLIYRDLPTAPTQVAALAAGIARCAEPARFYDVVTALMDGQAALLGGGPVRAWFETGIAASGKSETDIQACLGDPATLDSMRAGVAGANAAGVTSTPSFFVNGQRVTDTSLEGLSAAIQPLVSGPAPGR